MIDVLGMQLEEDGLIDGNRQTPDDDVVARGAVVRRIEPEEVLVRVVHQLGVHRPEFPVRSRVPEIERELLGLHFDLQGVGVRGRLIHARPHLGAHECEHEDLGTDQDRGQDDHRRRPSGERLDLPLGRAGAKSPRE